MVTIGSHVKENMVVCRNSQGIEIQATLLRLNRHLAAFEVYSPGNTLQTSEALSEFNIIMQDRTLYSGRAIIKSLVNAGLVLVCEATLGDHWLDADLTVGPDRNGKLQGEFRGFFDQWQKLYRVLPDYKVAIADLQSFLAELQLWLEQVELGIRSAPAADRIQLEREVAHELQGAAVEVIRNLFDRYELEARRVEEDAQPAHQAFGKRQLHPLLLCSPFVYRTLRKPLGYAGDYEMVNMMFRDPCEGSTLFAKLVNTYALSLPPIEGHRRRIVYLAEKLQEETLRRVRAGQTAKIFSLGCGPAHEIQRFLAQSNVCDQAKFTLADFNEETLDYLGKTMEGLRRQHGRRTSFELKKRSVHGLLKEAAKVVHGGTAERFDLVYCAGLFDYLPDKVCRQLTEVLYHMLAPGGLLLVTNVDDHPSRLEMECFLEWHLIYRNAAQLAKLAPSEVSPDAICLKGDSSTGVNVFLEIRKPEHA